MAFGMTSQYVASAWMAMFDPNYLLCGGAYERGPLVVVTPCGVGTMHTGARAAPS
jgi:hypothetical protein